MKIPVLTITPRGKVATYDSVRAASRSIGGKPTTSFNQVLSAVKTTGGGYVGNVFVTDGSNYTRK